MKDSTSSNHAYQIKGNRQLLHLKDAVDFISNKLDEFESDKKYKKLEGRSDISEGKCEPYNSRDRQARAVLKEEFPVDTWYT